MAYHKKIIGDGYFKVVHQIEDKKHTVAVLKDEWQASIMSHYLDMMESAWCYKVLDVEDKYLQEYSRLATKSGLAKDYLAGVLRSELNYLDAYFTTEPTMTDNEGVVYKKIVPKKGEK